MTQLALVSVKDVDESLKWKAELERLRANEKVLVDALENAYSALTAAQTMLPYNGRLFEIAHAQIDTAIAKSQQTLAQVKQNEEK